MEYLSTIDYVVVLVFLLKWFATYWVIASLAHYLSAHRKLAEARAENERAQAQSHRALAVCRLAEQGVEIGKEEAKNRVFRI